MSLRPAQELVQESSKFSLRQFFEAQQPVRSPAELPTEGFPTLNAQPDLGVGPHSPSGVAPPPPPFLRPQTPTAAAMGPPLPAPKDGKFTFTGMMPVTTPIQMQHKILQQHQQQALTQASTTGKMAGLQSDGASEVMRLKAQVVTLNDRIAQMSANLATTSESVIRGNKALTTERAQFHAKYANLTKKLEATQAALAEAEALPKEDPNHTKLLNAKVLELQLENEKLVTTRDALEASLAKAEAAAAETARLLESASEAPAATAALDDLQSKFTSLSAQHSTVLDRQLTLEREVEAKQELLEAAEGNVSAANERAEAWKAEVADLKQQLEASKVEIAQADNLVDTLDEKLAVARTGGPAGEVIKHTQRVRDYIDQNIMYFKPEAVTLDPGERVMEQDSGRVGTIVEGGRNWGVAWHPAVRYDDEPDNVSTEYNSSHFIVIANEAALPPVPWTVAEPVVQQMDEEEEAILGGDDSEAMEYLRRRAERRRNYQYDDMHEPPLWQDGSGVHFQGRVIDSQDWWRMQREAEAEYGEPTYGCCDDNCCPATARVEALERDAGEAHGKLDGAAAHEYASLHEEWKFRDELARRARHALTAGAPERVVVAHVHTCATPEADEASFDLASHIGANPLVMGKTFDDNCLHCRATPTDAAPAAPRDTSCAEARTNAFVAAVSKDLKSSMDGSQALYASSSTTGVALRV